jgi:hypothetical protein
MPAEFSGLASSPRPSPPEEEREKEPTCALRLILSRKGPRIGGTKLCRFWLGVAGKLQIFAG